MGTCSSSVCGNNTSAAVELLPERIMLAARDGETAAVSAAARGVRVAVERGRCLG